jgi:hypothetical protein
MILHKEDLDAIRDLVKEEVKAALEDKQPAKVKPAKPEKVEEKE